LSANESFITDFIETSKPKRSKRAANSFIPSALRRSESETRAPSIEDYVGLLQRNRHLLYNCLHQIAKKCPELRDEVREWTRDTLKLFRQSERSDVPSTRSSCSGEVNGNAAGGRSTPCRKRRVGAAGAMSSNLQSIFVALPAESRAAVALALDQHAAYLLSLEDLSMTRMQRVLDNMGDKKRSGERDKSPEPGSASMSGPGMFLSRWQDLLDRTLITPETPNGPIRQGKDVKTHVAQGKTAAISKDGWDPIALTAAADAEVPKPPDVEVVERTLGPAFRALLVDALRERPRE
jgi:hypothetical protein